MKNIILELLLNIKERFKSIIYNKNENSKNNKLNKLYLNSKENNKNEINNKYEKENCNNDI